VFSDSGAGLFGHTAAHRGGIEDDGGAFAFAELVIQTSKRQSQKAERKARAHRLIQQGVLFDLAGLAHRGRGELLGLLLAAAKTEDPHRWAAWKQAGDALLAEKGDAGA
jgi:hypothetical protein